MNEQLTRAIECAIRGTAPKTTKRMKVLAGIRWVLASKDGRFVAVNRRGEAKLVSELARATIYDGRDNEEAKCGFMQVLLKSPHSVVLVTCTPDT